MLTKILELSSDVPFPMLDAEHQLLIKVIASGVNRVDLLDVQNPHRNSSQILGVEFSGIIIDFNLQFCARCNRDLFINDHIIGLVPFGAYAQYIAISQLLIIKLEAEADEHISETEKENESKNETGSETQSNLTQFSFCFCILAFLHTYTFFVICDLCISFACVLLYCFVHFQCRLSPRLASQKYS
jgi:hypothetical protein